MHGLTFLSLDAIRHLMQRIARLEALAALTLLVFVLVPAASYLHCHGAGEHGDDECAVCTHGRQLSIVETTPPSLLCPTLVIRARVADPRPSERCAACSNRPPRGPPA